MRLKGKRAVITAAGAGIGQATALAYIAEGAEVIATDIDGDSLAPLAAAGARTHRLDVTDADAVAAFAAETGAIGILFNCAGHVHHGTILDCDPDAFEFSLDLNVRGLYRMTRAFLPAMIGAGGGTVVNMASAVSSIIAAPNRFVYGATKAAVIAMTKSVAADFVTQGIRANAICPGTVESPSWHARVRAQGEAIGDVDKARADFIARQPMGRIATSEEIAHLAVYLGSDESAFMTGQAVVIDGGWSNV
ncbi:SDR family oxidoreductase [Roseibacterium sp. SDUM158017]|uniref:SDR family oxidoreductase n=1 Tax=Roseicyclus salinarum TaxID=3036773 RepID=UPI0024158742|nr:SDR family oxidoreductase [Roseibacterium sp. SDUM158017]MDG4649545.1 SDR family oxidoreductase [Roseibacterium sp. SDUM158017]